jgi:hypothetical protein
MEEERKTKQDKEGRVISKRRRGKKRSVMKKNKRLYLDSLGPKPEKIFNKS